MTLFLYTEIKKKRKKYVIINSSNALSTTQGKKNNFKEAKTMK